MLLQHLEALYLASEGHGSIWNYLGVLVRQTGVSGRIVCGFWIVLHFDDAGYCYLPSQQTLPSASKFYQPASLNMTTS